LGQFVLIPLGENFYPVIHKVAHPAREGEGVCLLLHKETETYSLNGAFNQQMNAFNLSHFNYWVTLMIGKKQDGCAVNRSGRGRTC
jgi:hypothetical protein